jgi:ribosomal protein L31
MTQSAGADVQTDICSNCHPFYTGNQKIVDAAGRVEKFNKKYGEMHRDFKERLASKKAK